MGAEVSDAWIGRTLIDGDNRVVGVIEETYANKETMEPLWMVVRAGRFRAHRRFVPLASTTLAGEAVRTPRTKRQIDNSPEVDLTHQLSDEAVQALYRHYGMTLDHAPPAQDDPAPDGDGAIAERIRRYIG